MVVSCYMCAVCRELLSAILSLPVNVVFLVYMSVNVSVLCVFVSVCMRAHLCVDVCVCLSQASARDSYKLQVPGLTYN